MKKRVFALAAVLALIAALFTLSAFAADPNADYTEIGTADEFVTLMKSSANWSKNYRLTADIDLTGKGWNQTIGDLSTAFTGIFDGNGKTIKGLSLSSISHACVGLFGTTRDAEIRNLTVEGTVKVPSKRFIGGLIGAICGETLVENCTSNVTVTGDSRVGGMIGGMILNTTAGTYPADSKNYTVIIRGCVSKGTVSTTKGERVGGLIGSCSAGNSFSRHAVIENCTNEATVSNAAAGSVGGIIGYIDPQKSEQTVTIKNCENNGSVTGLKNSGGIAGDIRPSVAAASEYEYAVRIIDCKNSGTVTVKQTTWGQVGGIVGIFVGKGGTQLLISGCSNTGKVDATVSKTQGRAGGIIGYIQVGSTVVAVLDVYDCTNAGAIVGTSHVGGVVGYYEAAGTLTVARCINTGKIEASGSFAAGIIGAVKSKDPIQLSSLYNSGEVTSDRYGAGIIAYFSSTSNESYLIDAFNEGTIHSVGGVVGGVVGNSKLESGAIVFDKLYNNGMVVSDTADHVGGVAGAVATASEDLMTNCYYSQDINCTKESDRHTTETKVTPASTIAENEKVFAGLAPRYLEDGWIILPDGPMLLFMHTHTYDSDGVCTACGRKDAASCEHTGGTHIGVVSSVANCMNEGKYQVICDDCWTVVDEISTPIEKDNHKLEWVLVNGELVCKCVNQNEKGETCDYVARTYTDSASEVYVSDEGFRVGGFSAESPINDYYKALELAQLAAQRDGKSTATVYVVGQVTVPMSAKGTFLEPAHADVEITVKGYGDGEAAFVFGDESSEIRLEYGLNGDTVFDNLEIGGKTTGQLYFSARHNHLTMGQKISMDFRRNKSGELHSGAVTVLGGCYSSNFGACSGKNAHLTLGSGTYRNVITGSANRSCGLANGKCTLEITGSILSREGIFAGSSGGNAGDIDLIIRGDASAAGYFSFGSSSGKTAKNVRVYLYEGSIFSRSFDAKQSQTAQVIAPIGCSSATNAINAGMTSLVIYYDPSSPSAVEMMNMIKTSSNGGASVDFRVMSTACKVTGSEHTHAAGAEPVDSVDASCAAEGYKVYTCTACGENYTEIIEKLPHTWARNESLDKKATCKDAGMAAYACTVCNAVKYEVKDDEPATGEHTPENGVCTVCNYSAAANCTHEFEYDPTNPDATEITACGKTTYEICSKCKLKKIRTSTGSHNWGKYSVTVEPTDTTPGTKTRKCKTCGKVETALLYPNDTTLATDPIAVDASGNAVDFSVESSKLTKAEKEALNALLQSTAYGSEVKVSYTTDGTTVTNVTYSIPVPDAYKDYDNVKVVVKDDDGVLHTVDFKIEKGYIVFTF